MKKIKALSGLAAVSAVLLAAAPLAFAAPGDSISGGGQLLDSNDFGDNFKISFGVWANEISSGIYEGEAQVNFHSVSGYSKSKFHGTKVTQMRFFASDSDTCNAAMNMTVEGTFDGMPGYKIIFRAGDAGSPGNTNAAEPFDTARITVYYGSQLIYDTDGGDFERQSSCVGTARTGLDRGNLTIKMN